MKLFRTSQVVNILVLCLLIAFVAAVQWARHQGLYIPPVIDDTAALGAVGVAGVCRSYVPKFAGLTAPATITLAPPPGSPIPPLDVAPASAAFPGIVPTPAPLSPSVVLNRAETLAGIETLKNSILSAPAPSSPLTPNKISDIGGGEVLPFGNTAAPLAATPEQGQEGD